MHKFLSKLFKHLCNQYFINKTPHFQYRYNVNIYKLFFFFRLREKRLFMKIYILFYNNIKRFGLFKHVGNIPRFQDSVPVLLVQNLVNGRYDLKSSQFSVNPTLKIQWIYQLYFLKLFRSVANPKSVQMINPAQ